MLPPAHPLIEAATEALANNAEQRLGANDMLEQSFDPTHPGVEDATLRIQAVGRRTFPILKKAFVWVLAAAALATVILSNIPAIRITETIFNFNLFEPIEKPQLPEGLSEEALLILGNPELTNFEQTRRLHEFDPQNPAYFAEYAQIYVSENDKLPPDFLETAERIAPDNAFFVNFAAGRLAREAIEKKISSRPRSKPRFVDGVKLRPLPRESEFDIKDQKVFDEALALLEKATSMPDFETYTNQLIVARTRLLPVGNITEFIRSLFYVYGSPSPVIQLRNVADLFSARAEQLLKEGRKEEFIELAEQRDAFIAQLGRNPDINLIGELVYSVVATATATNFRFAAERLELAELEEKYRSQADAFQNERDLREIRGKKEPEQFPSEKASALAGLTFPMVSRQVNSPVAISASDFQPMRMAEHELLAKIGLFAAALCLPIAAAVVFCFRFIFPPVIRFPAARMSHVLGMADRIWVVGLGIVLPVILFMVITRLTPLGGRDYGAKHFMFAFPLVHLVALLLSLLIAPAIVVRWRLGKRLAPLGLGDRYTVPVALAVLAMLLAWSLTALSALTFVEMSNFTLLVLAAPPALCLCIVFLHGLRSLLGSPTGRITQCATATAVLPNYAIAVVVLCLLTPIHSAGEKHWIAKETMFRIDPDAADLGAYEYKVAAQKRKETNALLGFEY